MLACPLGICTVLAVDESILKDSDIQDIDLCLGHDAFSHNTIESSAQLFLSLSLSWDRYQKSLIHYSCLLSQPVELEMENSFSNVGYGRLYGNP